MHAYLGGKMKTSVIIQVSTALLHFSKLLKTDMVALPRNGEEDVSLKS